MPAQDEIAALYESYLTYDPEDVLDYERFHQYSIIYHSNAIENSTLTENETLLLLDQGLTPGGKPLNDALMATDHLSAMKFIFSLADKKMPLRAQTLKDSCALLIKHTGARVSSIGGDYDISKGAFRRGMVRAGNTVFMDFKKIPDKIEALLNYINQHVASTLSLRATLELASTAHYQFVMIHPFGDGNGRMARLLMNYILLYQKFPLAYFFQEDKEAYYTALIGTRKAEDLGIFIDFCRAQYAKGLRKEIDILSREPKQKRLSDDEKSGPPLLLLF